jgi:hypothetical protein
MVTVPLETVAETVAGAAGATPLPAARYNRRFGDPIASEILFDVAPLISALDTCEFE